MLKEIPGSYWFRVNWDISPDQFSTLSEFNAALHIERQVQKGELVRFPSIKALTDFWKKVHYKRERMQDPKIKHQFDYTQGPMFFLGQQIVKAMQKSGYPAKILFCHRTAEHQARLYAQGRTASGSIVTRAKPWDSAHNYFEACDIIHPTKAWDVSEEYWAALASCVRTVGNKYGVKLVHGHDWDGDGVPVHMDPDERFRDSAHIQLADWRTVRERLYGIGCTTDDLWVRFEQVLPKVAKTLLVKDWRGRWGRGRVPRVISDAVIGTGLPK